jgi:hypothetical protein
MKRRNMVLTPALTPALSPGRGIIVRRVLIVRESSDIRAVSRANHRKAALVKLSIESSETCDRCSLSSGERVRVRASVPLNCLFYSNVRRRHRPRVIRQRMRSAFLKRIENRVTNKLLLASQLPVPETKLLDAHRSQELSSLGIVNLLVGMPVMSAIEFDGEAGFHAIEVEVVNPARVVATKFVTAETAVSQPTPHEFFGPSLLLAQGAGAGWIGHGKKVAIAVREEKNGLNDRPHPSPLPQERENRLPAPRISTRTYCSCVASSELPRHRDGQFDSRIIRNAQKLSPLPGGEGQGEGERETNFSGDFKNLVSTTALTPALSPRRGRIVRCRSTCRKAVDYSQVSAQIYVFRIGGAS